MPGRSDSSIGGSAGRDAPSEVHGDPALKRVNRKVSEAILKCDSGELHRLRERCARLEREMEECRRNAERYSSVVEEQTDLLCRFDLSGNITFANREFSGWFDLENGFGGKNLFMIFPEEEGKKFSETLSVLCRERPVATIEHSSAVRDCWIQWKIQALYDEKGQCFEFQGAGRDITALKRAEERMRFSLAEKEALLGEVHHRVKNNLQIVSSLLDMSSLHGSTQEAANLIRDARSRIHTMALIHSQLMKSDRFDRIDMRQHTIELLTHLFHVFDAKHDRIDTVVDITDVYLTVDRAVPFALVLHEILSNSFRHAFPNGRKGTIRICIASSENGMVSADISDNGIGMQPWTNPDRADTFGIRMIHIIVLEQLEGTVEQDCSEGAGYRITFHSGIREE
jgi:PAS domain S-box-containing protein